jgi:hypothetical protein
MAGISLVAVWLLGQAPARDPAELVRQLGAARYAEREAASAALEAMGPAALPALRTASESKDPELRNRVAAIAAKIEWRELKEASPIRLDVADQSLNSIVEDFGFPSPSRLAWRPDTPEAVRQRPVTIREPAPLPFWTAIDRVCKAGELRYIPGAPDGAPGRTSEFRLYLAPGTWDGPRADFGPLRLEIVGIYHSSQVNLIPRSPYVPTARSGPPQWRFGEREEQFHITMRILAEPRMLIRAVGDALIAEAVDDRGQSLFPVPAPYLYHFGYSFGGTPRAWLDYSLNLKHPVQAGPVIKRLKLTIPVEVESLKPDRLEIPLANSVGKTFRHGTTAIEVLAVGADRQGHQKVTLKVSSDEMVPERLTLDWDGKLAQAAGRLVRPEVTPNVIQVLDQEGRQFPWYVENVQANDPEVTAELLMWPEGGIPIHVPAGHGVVPPGDRATAVPAVIHHTETARGVVVATFEFHDVPLP